jgi:cell division protein ZapA (FtsZ GTPase activity inhibitor)
MKKLDQKDLDNLVESNRRYRDLKFEIADIEMTFERLKNQKISIMANLEVAAHDLSKLQGEIQEKYKANNINLATGEYN